jgi:Domain of unknown function (DUF4129)
MVHGRGPGPATRAAGRQPPGDTPGVRRRPRAALHRPLAQDDRVRTEADQRERRRRRVLSRRPDRLTAAAVVVVLALLVLAGIAARGPAVVSGTGSALPTPDEPLRPPAPARTSDPDAAATETPADGTTLPPSPLAGYVVLGLLTVVGVAAAGLLGRSLWEHRPALRRRRPPPSAPVREAADALARAARAAVTEVVAHPVAREAVVRSWLLLGAAAAEAGLPARDAETAGEYARRLALRIGLPGPELARLAELYREARFSTHEVGEEQRAVARRLLHDLGGRLERTGS